MSYVIISDSSSDLITHTAENYSCVPLKIITDNKEYVDDADLNLGEMIEDLKKYKGKSRSSCPNAEDWLSAMQGYDTVFCVTITSGLSGSNNTANIALKEYLDENPDAKGYVVDSLSAGPEVALLVEKLATLLGEGLDFETAKTKIEEYKATTHLTFCLESLRNLANNGRVSGAVAKIAGILGIRIVGVASLEDTLEVCEKARGAEKALSSLIKNIESNGYCGGRMRIHHCRALGNANAVADRIRERYPDAEIIMHETGALCSFYAEEGGLLIGYEGAKKY